MHQQQDVEFQDFLQHAHNRQLDKQNVYFLNTQVAVDLSSTKPLKDAVFAQTNNTWHVINQN